MMKPVRLLVLITIIIENESYSYDDNGNRTNEGYVTGDNNPVILR